MTAAYPLGLRTIVQASKSRSQPASFRVHQPRRGYGYAQQIGTDTPVIWSIGLRFTQSEATRFQLWFRYEVNSGADEFLMPIKTEFGLVDHVCRFLPDGLLDASETADTVQYSAQIMARAQVIPQEYQDAAGLIIASEDWESDASWVDIGVNQEWIAA